MPVKKRKSQTKAKLGVQRGSLVTLKKGSPGTISSNLALIVSNNIQNEVSDFILIVPLEKRKSRLKAPFSVDLGKSNGLNEIHTARCDWITKINTSEVKSIERAQVSKQVLDKLDQALKVSLGFSESI